MRLFVARHGWLMTCAFVSLGANVALGIDGACCLPNGDCIVTSQTNCIILGGGYERNFSTCCDDSIACTDPTCGACCRPDNVCVVLPDTSCYGLGGVYQSSGTSCDASGVCGACCDHNGSCFATVSENCSGNYQPGATCGPGVCPSWGPCCDSAGHCVNDFEPECIASGGGLPAPGSACVDAWPLEISCGACCLEDRICVILTTAECESLGGRLSSPPCDPSGTCSEGACCVANGSCAYRSESDCAAVGGVFQGHWSECGEVVCGACCTETSNCSIGSESDCAETFFEGVGCSPEPCPQPTACCLPNGTCDEVLAVDCQVAGGTSLPDTPCDPETCWGACCSCDATCSIAGEAECEAHGDRFVGPGADCEGNCSVRFGACCGRDGECFYPRVQVTCEVLGGFYPGDCSACEECISGACCLPNGHCESLTAFACDDEGGHYYGDSTSCEGVSCATGACCRCNGECLYVDANTCINSQGQYQGDGSSCVDAPCRGEDEICLQFGACCSPNGRCDEVSDGTCSAIGGSFAGFGTRCGETDECVGACCLVDGSCEPKTGPSCEAFGGTYQGAQTFCDEGSCSERGACCYGNGTCVDYVTRERCEYTDGGYAGDNSTCDLVPDFDGDKVPDACDEDIDNDGVVNDLDVCDYTPLGASVAPNGTFHADADRDCDVDLHDHAILQNELTGANP